MDKSKDISDRSRREFLKQVGGALGGLAIAGGFGTDAGAQSAMPSAYKFYRVLSANDGTNSVQSLSAAAIIGGLTLLARIRPMSFIFTAPPQRRSEPEIPRRFFSKH